MTEIAVEAETKASEETAIHTRLLRIGLAEEDSRAYWAHADRILPFEERVTVAFQERWFGSRSMARVRYLLRNFQHRFEAFPGALPVLHRWAAEEIADRTLLCHWHVQLSDPLYREFTSSLLEQRRLRPQPNIDRNTAVRWVDDKMEGRWSSSTSQRMASGLLSCATEAGLCEGTKAVRGLNYPRVSGRALGSLLSLLKETASEGTLRDNPYTPPVGLQGEFWEERVRKLPWIEYRRMADLHDLKWEFESLEDWGREVLSA